MGELIDLVARRARRDADEDGAAARSRLAACAVAAGGRVALARMLTERLGWQVRPGHLATWEATVTPPGDVLLAAEAVTLQVRTLGTRIAAAAGHSSDLRAVATACGPAVAADVVLRHAIDTPAAEIDPATHPLASCVLRRDVVDMLAWPVTGQAPPGLAGVDAPALEDGERAAFFDHCRQVVDRAAHQYRDPADPQPHRQAVYFLQWDPHPDTQEWIQDVERRDRRRWRPQLGWTPRWVTARSAAITQARRGDLGPLRRFVAEGLAGRPDCEDADLQYWAYWLCADVGTWETDEEMTRGLGSWDAQPLLDRLAAGIRASDPLLDLHVHSVAALLQRRPHLAATRTGVQLRARAAATLAAPDLDPATRVTLQALARP